MYAHLFKYNKFHGKGGQFASKDGAVSPTGENPSAKSQKEALSATAEANAIPPKPPRSKNFTQPESDTIDGLFKVAHASKSEFDSRLQVLASGVDATIMHLDHVGPSLSGKKSGNLVILGPMKTKERVSEKAWDYAKENGGKPDYSKVGDILRCTVAVDTVQDITKVLASLNKAGFELARDPKIRIEKPTEAGYRDVLVNARLSTGHVVEVQINTKKMLVAKNVAHKLYEQERSIMGTLMKENRSASADEKKTVDDLRERQVAIYSKAWKDSGG